MNPSISWHTELKVKSGQLEAFRRLTREMVDATRRERGVLIYERHIDEDGRTVHVYERYVDSAAAFAHLQEFLKAFSDRFRGLVERKRFVVYGAPSAELKALLDRFGASYMARLDGFSFPQDEIERV